MGEARRDPHSVPPPRRKRGQHLRCEWPEPRFVPPLPSRCCTHAQPLTASPDAGYYTACSFSALKRDARSAKANMGTSSSARLWDLSAFDRFSDMSNSFPQLGFSRYPGGLKLRPVPADNLVLIASFTKKLHAMHDRVRSGQHHS